MNFTIRCIMLWVLGAIMCLGHAKEIRLMFGAEKQGQKPNQFLDFQYITPKSTLFRKKPIINAWRYNPERGAAWSFTDRGPEPADTLLENGMDCVDACLIIPCSNGEKILTLYLGDWFVGVNRFAKRWDKYHRCRAIANGQTLFDIPYSLKFFTESWLKGDDYVFSTKDDCWKWLVEPVLDIHRFKVKITDGNLTLALNNILLTALTLSDSDTEADRTALAVETERRRQFTQRYPWKPQPDEPLPDVSEISQKRKLVIFQKYGEDSVFPWTRPDKEEIRDIIRVFAAKGEQEMFRFGVIPLQDIVGLKVEVDDFKSADGKHRLSIRDHADLWLERYKPLGSGSLAPKITHIRQLDPKSRLFQKMKPQNCESGTPRMFVLDVRVPTTALAGDYFAPVTFRSATRVIAQCRLQLKVLPFRLRYDGSAQYNFQILAMWNETMPEVKLPRRERAIKEYDFFSKYHFSNNYFPFFGKLGHVEGKLGERYFAQTPQEAQNLKNNLEVIRKHANVDFIIVPYWYFHWNIGSNLYTGSFNHMYYKKDDSADRRAKLRKDTARIMKGFDDLMKSMGSVPLYWYVHGESDNFGMQGAQAAVDMGKLCQEVGLKTFITVNGCLAAKMCPPHYDFFSCNGATPITQQLLDDIKKNGGNFGSHNTGDNRFLAGFQFWRLRGFAKHQETIFYTTFLKPRLYLPWNFDTAQVMYNLENEYIPSLQFLNYRDGRDDYLYMHNLERVINEARKRKVAETNPALKEAVEFVRNMENLIHLDLRKYMRRDHKIVAAEGTLPISDEGWNPTAFERYRWHIAQLIINLEATK